MKTVRRSLAVTCSAVLLVLVLVGVLVWLLVSKPSFQAAGGRSVPCRAIIGEIGRGNQGGISLVGIDGLEQEDELREFMELGDERQSSWNDVARLERVRAALVMGRACQDARLNRQTSVNLTLAALVVVVIPMSLYGVQRLNSNPRSLRPSDSTRDDA